MKTIIAIIILILVIGITIFIGNKKQTPINTETNTEQIINEETANTEKVSLELDIKDGIYTLNNTSETKLSWTAKKKIIKDWIDTGTISLKEAMLKVEGGKVVSNEFVIDMTTIKTQNTGSGKNQDQLSKHLKSADFFDTENFPIATFKANSFEKIASTSDSFMIKGDLTIKDITNTVTIGAKIQQTDSNILIIKGDVNIDRTLWSIRYGSDTFFNNLGNNVIDNIFNLAFEIQLNTTENNTYKMNNIEIE